MSAYEHALYTSPISLPERTSGPAQIRHRTIPAGADVIVVGLRQAFLRGIRPVSVRLAEPLRIHELFHEDYGVWMTDLPEELNQIGELLRSVEPSGRVLIGGLGLGILAHVVSARVGVERVVVIEKDEHVINLCAKRRYSVVHADIAEYLLRSTRERFDFFLLDTWQQTGESTWWSDVLPLRRIIRNRWGGKPVVHCWAEDIMHGQLLRSLTTHPEHWYCRGLQMPMTEAVARKFLRDVGLPTWEKKYGGAIDATIEAKAKAKTTRGNRK